MCKGGELGISVITSFVQKRSFTNKYKHESTNSGSLATRSEPK